MKAYLDNNVVSAIAKDDTPEESDALDRLLVAMGEGKVDLVTSDVTLTEIKKLEGPWRKLTERTFRLSAKVPVVSWDTLLGIHSYGDAYTWINSPMIARDDLYTSLLSLGLDTVDAQHVFVAVRTGCDRFLTCDGKVLRRGERIRTFAPLIVQKPSALVTSEGW
jgi:predicted nucleic acid-binding protein